MSPQTVRQWIESAHGTGLRLFSVLMNLLISIVCARLLGDSGFGVYVSIMAMAGLLATITSVGLPTVLAREIATARGTGDTSPLPPIAQAILATQGLLLVAVLVALSFGKLSVAGALVFALGTNVLGVAMHVFIGFERVLTAHWIGMVVKPVLATLGFLLLAWMAALSAQTAVLIQAATGFLGAGVLWVIWRGMSMADAARHALVRPNRAELTAVARTGVTFAVAQTLINAMTQVDILILTAMRPSEEVAWYYAAARAAMVVSFFFSSVSKMAEPKLVRLFASGDLPAAQALARSTSLLGVVMTLIATVLAMVLARFYLNLYGPDYVAALPVMFVMMLGQIGLSFSGPGQPILRAARSDTRILWFAGVALATGALISVSLIPVLGMLGAAVGSAIQFTLFGLLLSRRAWRDAGIRTPVWSVLRSSDMGKS